MTRFITFDTTYGSIVTVQVDKIIALEKTKDNTYHVITEGEVSFKITAETYERFMAVFQGTWKNEQSK